MATSLNNTAWLEWVSALMGGVSRQTHAATFPPDRYYCLLDELPVHLIPRQFVSSRVWRQGQPLDLYLNPACTLRSAEDLPDDTGVSNEIRSAFALQGTIAWVRDSQSQALLPFWLGPELESVVRSLRPGESVPASMPDSTRRLLAVAGILVPNCDAAQATEGSERIQRCASAFREKGYAPISELIHPFHVAALRRYYRYLIRSGVVELGDSQSPRRYVAYNEPVALFFHRQIAALLSSVAGEPLKPSYVYMASYLSAAELKKHIDREQCEFSITCCLDFSPEPDLATPWPINLETPGGIVTVYQALGDGLAYRGTRLPHYRGKLSEGRTSTSIFFHYVGADFAGPLR